MCLRYRTPLEGQTHWIRNTLPILVVRNAAVPGQWHGTMQARSKVLLVHWAPSSCVTQEPGRMVKKIPSYSLKMCRHHSLAYLSRRIVHDDNLLPHYADGRTKINQEGMKVAGSLHSIRIRLAARFRYETHQSSYLTHHLASYWAGNYVPYTFSISRSDNLQGTPKQYYVNNTNRRLWTLRY